MTTVLLFIEIIIWPLLIFITVLILRSEIKILFNAIAERAKSIDAGGFLSIELATQNLKSKILDQAIDEDIKADRIQVLEEVKSQIIPAQSARPLNEIKAEVAAYMTQKGAK